MYIRKNNGECEVFPAPFWVFLSKDDENYVEPDISVICDINKLTDKGCYGAPDWIIEIVSPSGKAMDCFTKLFKYRTAGVREYWIVDPIKELVIVYQFEKETMEQYIFGEDVPVGIYDDYVTIQPYSFIVTMHTFCTKKILFQNHTKWRCKIHIFDEKHVKNPRILLRAELLHNFF